MAEVAEAFSHQNGKALRATMRDMYEVYGDERFVRLARISTAHIYNLKHTEVFKTIALTYTKTHAVQVPIGQRKKPYPEGKPSYLRGDSVHQGDLEKEKGVYHINLVDEVTQDEVVVCVAGISEQFLAPALEVALASFPYHILNFHSDNGSEYINKVTARLLEKLRISQTKSRSRKTNDNALVEGKNATVVRTCMGRIHIPQEHAEAINEFYKTYFNPFLRFHRFCAFPEEVVDARGKVTKKYRVYMTPIQKLLSLPDAAQYLKDGVTKELLQKEANATSHLAAAQEMQQAKQKLFASFHAKTML